MPEIEIIKSGIVYRNPKPILRSIQAYFASPVELYSGKLFVSMSLGQAMDAIDMRIYTAHSSDCGETWKIENPDIHNEVNHPVSYFCRSSKIDSKVVMLIMQYNRIRTEESLTNPSNIGFVETRFMIMSSDNGGHTWNEPKTIETSIIGPSFELCCPIVKLRDGRWIIPTSTWRGWDGYCPGGMRAVMLVSYDRGKTWPEAVDVFSDVENKILFWEQRIVELSDGSLVAVAWVYDEANGRDRPNHFAISNDRGKTFGKPISSGIIGQTMDILPLENNRILAVYRRIDEPGLWANIIRIKNNTLVNECEMPVWGAQIQKHASGTSLVKDFNNLRFGAPHMIRLSDGNIFGTFWAVEDCVSNIRWFKLSVK